MEDESSSAAEYRLPQRCLNRVAGSIVPMDMTAVTQLVAMKAARTRQSAMIAFARKTHEMAMSLVEMIAETARSAPPPGQGTRVDKVA
jgi:hypothetical protein